ncbi:hypothetical protein SNEBB_004102 [Seison nebaliae]|nr:hypothetical protein SNEBB_004102 [Seison nebaliae]
MKRVISLDQGTSSTKCFIYEYPSMEVLATSTEIVPLESEQVGWASMKMGDVLQSCTKVIENCLNRIGRDKQIDCIGITNQRESICAWRKSNGEMLSDVILWYDNRTKDIVGRYVSENSDEMVNWIEEETGLIFSTYFSVFKMNWLLQFNEKVKKAAKENDLFRMMMVRERNWSEELLKLFDIQLDWLPKIHSSDTTFGYWELNNRSVPVTAILGDQQAAFYRLLKEGIDDNQKSYLKCTYGTGAFLLAVADADKCTELPDKQKGILSTVGYHLKTENGDGNYIYVNEGSIALAGTANKYINNLLLKEKKTPDDVLTQLYMGRIQKNQVLCYSNLNGCFTPHWNSNMKAIYGNISLQSTPHDYIYATMESLAFQTKEILQLIGAKLNPSVTLFIDGGVTGNCFFTQFLANVLNIQIARDRNDVDATAKGVAILAGESLSHEKFQGKHQFEQFKPDMKDQKILEERYGMWCILAQSSRRLSEM